MVTPDETVEANLANPARVRIANQEVEQHSLADQIAAAKYLAESSGATAAATQPFRVAIHQARATWCLVTERVSPILDPYGKPIVHRNGKPRPELAEAFEKQAKRRDVRARYDAAQTTDDNKNYWASADAYDADSANSKDVRSKLVQRSRYEIGNNGYADGIAQTYATDLVGIGPKLRMQTGSIGFHRLVEFEWNLWSQAVKLRRKLWCQAHAKLAAAIILGTIGYNFAAGMTGGLVYVYDEDGTAGRRINRQLVNVEPLTAFETDYVQQWIQHHFNLTSSPRAEAILNDWANQSAKFLKVAPKEAAAQTQPIAIPRSAVSASAAVKSTVKKAQSVAHRA